MPPLEDDLFSALRDLALCLHAFPGRAAIIGGIATVFLGRPRATSTRFYSSPMKKSQV